MSIAEESSNGKIEDTQKVELMEEDKIEETQIVEQQKEDEDEVVIEAVVEEFKTADEGSLKVNIVEENSFFVRPAQNVNLEEEKEVDIESVVPSSEEFTQVEETPVNKLGVSDGTECEPKENGEKILPSSTGEINGFSAVINDVVLKGIEESTSKENGDSNMMEPDENIGESSDIVDLASKGNVGNLLQQQPADVPSVETSNVYEQIDETEIPESTGTKPIISMTPRVLQPSSWWSCCGLFDVLRRSNR